MGNCIKKQSSTQWGGEDWEFIDASKGAVADHAEGVIKEEGNKGGKFSSPMSTVTEVKIKITKKQLEELLGKVDVQGLTVQQVLTQLMISGDGGYVIDHIQRSWRPALQSIPEAELY